MEDSEYSTRHVELGPRRRDGTPSRSRPGRTVLAWAGATALVAAGAALATATYTGDGGTQVETPTGRVDTARPACVWLTQVDGPVVPAELLGAAPTPESILIFEKCDGDWTGDMAWMHSGSDLGPGSDDGLPNAWEAGNRAVARYLEEADRP